MQADGSLDALEDDGSMVVGPSASVATGDFFAEQYPVADENLYRVLITHSGSGVCVSETYDIGSTEGQDGTTYDFFSVGRVDLPDAQARFPESETPPYDDAIACGDSGATNAQIASAWFAAGATVADVAPVTEGWWRLCHPITECDAWQAIDVSDVQALPNSLAIQGSGFVINLYADEYGGALPIADGEFSGFLPATNDDIDGTVGTSCLESAANRTDPYPTNGPAATREFQSKSRATAP